MLDTVNFLNTTDETAPVALLIPALDPSSHLTKLLENVASKWSGPIVVVDDGSTRTGCSEIFTAAEKLGVKVFHHEHNLGKGAALKQGFKKTLDAHPNIVGFVTADADGQHAPCDIFACADALQQHPESLVLGCRDFDSDNVPAHNGAGNKITRIAMRLFCDVNVSDTQTGLRAIPTEFARALIDVKGNGFEFETAMLIEARHRNVPFFEVPIQTIYDDSGQCSHFNVLTDSIRIYWQFMKFTVSSMTSSLVDLAAFTALLWLISDVAGGWAITVATIFARIISGLVNYALNKTVVFKSEERTVRSLLRYTILCVCVMATSSALVTAFVTLTGTNATLVKIVVDVCLFFVNYQVQQRWVY